MTSMLRTITGFMAMVGVVSLAHAHAPGPQPITQYETPAEARWAPFSSNLPACDEPSVVSTITGRFAEAENTYWGGGNAIESIDQTREIGFRANGLGYIPRRYCVARAAVVDPRVPPPPRPRLHTVVYSVTAAAGIIGWSWGVEWCVAGFDREHAYEPACEVLRPILERWLGEQTPIVKARY
jgi:hypothetical protein